MIADAGAEAWTIDGGRDAHADEPSGRSRHSASSRQPRLWTYTSGSTGAPKGAACSHRASRRGSAGCRRSIVSMLGETLLHKTPFSFDVSVWEILWPLVIGARLAIAAPGAHREPRLGRCRRRP